MRYKFDGEPMGFASLPTTLLAIGYPSLDANQQDHLVNRVIRSKESSASMAGWQWQARVVAAQLPRAYRGAAAGSATRAQIAGHLERINGRWTIGAAQAEAILKSGDVTDPVAAKLYGVIGTAASRTGEARWIDVLIDGIDDPRDVCAATCASHLTSLPDGVWNDIHDDRIIAMMKAFHATPNGHSGLILFDRLLITIESRRLATPELLNELIEVSRAIQMRIWPPRTVEMLAVLRRLEGRPAPLQLKFDIDELRWPANAPADVPALKVRFANAETERPDLVHLIFGGDNRGPRWERLRITLRREEDGAEVQSYVPTNNFGGMMSWGQLKNDQIAYDILLPRYIRKPPPGKYQLRVQYHDRQQISALTDIGRYFVFESDPIWLVVEGE